MMVISKTLVAENPSLYLVELKASICCLTTFAIDISGKE